MPSARDRVLDAYETLLIEHGPAAATLDAVASAAGVSKGGLLYHFGSKDALADGLLVRLRQRSRADADEMRAAPDGSVAYYLRSSAAEESSTGLARTYLAALRLAGGSAAGTAAREALSVVDADGFEALHTDLGDPVLATLVQLVGDGLYLRTLSGTTLPEGLGVEDLLTRMRKLTG